MKKYEELTCDEIKKLFECVSSAYIEALDIIRDDLVESKKTNHIYYKISIVQGIRNNFYISQAKKNFDRVKK